MLKVGIIGSKYLEKNYIQSINSIKSVSLIGFYDSNKATCRKIEKEYNIKAFNTIDELIESTDAIDLMSEETSHFEYCIQSIKKSKHIFIPICNNISTEDLKKIIDLANEAGVVVKIKNAHSYNPAYLSAKNFISNPMYIETNRMLSYSEDNKDISVVMDLMIKDIEIVLNHVKSNVRKISANGISIVNHKPDIANVRIEFDNACVANLTVNRISKSNFCKTQFFSQDSSITVDFHNQKAEIFKIKNNNSSEKEKPFIFKKLPVENNNPLTLELEDFFYTILHPTNSLNNAINTYQSLQIAQKIKEKIEFPLSTI